MIPIPLKLGKSPLSVCSLFKKDLGGREDTTMHLAMSKLQMSSGWAVILMQL